MKLLTVGTFSTQNTIGPEIVSQSSRRSPLRERFNLGRFNNTAVAEEAPGGGLSPLRLKSLGKALRNPFSNIFNRRDLQQEAVKVLPELIGFLKDKDPQIRIDAVSVLRNIGKEAGSAVPELKRLLNNNDEYEPIKTLVKTLVIMTLGKIGKGALSAVQDIADAIADKRIEKSHGEEAISKIIADL